MNLCSLFLAASALAAIAPLSLQAQDPKVKAPFVEADKNGDGKLSETEFVAMSQGKVAMDAAKKRFAELDKDRNKFLTREEFLAGAKAQGAAAAGNAAGGTAAGEKKEKAKPKDDSRR